MNSSFQGVTQTVQDPLSVGARWLSQVGAEATHHQYKLQALDRLEPWAGGRLRGLISRAEGLPQKSGLRILFLIFFLQQALEIELRLAKQFLYTRGPARGEEHIHWLSP